MKCKRPIHILAAFLAFGCVYCSDAIAHPQLPLKIVGQLSGDGFFAGGETYRAVQVKIPWVYALDRDGGLHVYRLPRNTLLNFAAGVLAEFRIRTPFWLDPQFTDEPTVLEEIKTLKGAGDGNDLEIVGDHLLLTCRGRLAVYSIAQGPAPQHQSTEGSPEADDSKSIVRKGDNVFLLGGETISSFEFSDGKLNYRQTRKTELSNWNGCLFGKYLYVSGRSKNRAGIAVYDTSNEKAIVEKYFLPTPRLAYHIFMNQDDHLICCIDSESRFHSITSKNITVSGTTMIYKTTENQKPDLASTNVGSGGRTAVALNYNDQTVLLCNGIAFESKADKLISGYTFFPDGTTLDGAPYGGDQCGSYSALATDRAITIFRYGAHPACEAGHQFAKLLRSIGCRYQRC